MNRPTTRVFVNGNAPEKDQQMLLQQLRPQLPEQTHRGSLPSSGHSAPDPELVVGKGPNSRSRAMVLSAS